MKWLNRQTAFLVCFLLTWGKNISAFQCDVIPEGIKGERSKDDIGRYRIEISGNAEAYVPGEQYTSKSVILKSNILYFSMTNVYVLIKKNSYVL